MSILRFIVAMLPVGLMALGAGIVAAQAYPNKTIRIVTGAPGGGSDFVARFVAQGISGPLGQPIIVENRSSGIVPAEIVSKALPDGYTLFLSGSNFWIGPLLQKMPYDPVKDFSPITSIDRSPDVLVVHPSVSATSVKELIALAKAKPGELNFAASSSVGPGRLGAELFKAMAGIDIVRIPYKGGGPALSGLLSGESQLLFASPASTMPHIKSKKLRALGITSTAPSALIPGVPTIAESMPGFESISITCIFAPAKTPLAVITRLNQEIVRFLDQPEVKDRFLKSGVETAGTTPQQLATTMKSDMAKWSKLIKDAGIKSE